MAASAAFDAATTFADPASLPELRRQCMAMARRRAGLSALSSFVPLPGVGLLTDAAVLLALLAEINRRFGLTEAQIEMLSPARKALAYKLTTAAGGFVAARFASSRMCLVLLRRAGARLGIMEAARFAPLVGQAISAGIAYVTLTRIARRHIEQCAAIAGRIAA